MVSNHPAKFGGQRHCSGGDMMFLVVEGQDSTCPCFNCHFCLSLKRMACYFHTHEISRCRHNN